jgi:anti-sigma-K factor RskA
VTVVDIHTLAGGYALDAVDDLERAAFSRHLRGCEACAIEVGELRETVARLGAASAEPPPPGLRSRVLDEIARTRQTVAGRGLPVRAAADWRRWTTAAAAAVVLAVGAGAATWVTADQRVRQARGRAEALAVQQARVGAVLAAGDVQLRTALVPGGGRITVAVSPSRDAGVVVMADLPVPPSGRAYQLWLLDGGAARSAGVLAAGQQGGVTLVQGTAAAQSVAVTVEPAGGSARPTGTPVVAVALRSA